MQRLAGVLLATVAAGFASAASAADMPVKAPQAAPAVAAPYSWTGFYFGGHVGYGWSSATGTITPADPTLFFVFDPAAFNLDGNGIIGGAQVGYNWQVAPNWVIGVEADISGTGIRGSSFAPVTLGGVPAFGGRTHYMSKEIEWLATLRGRLGYAWDRWMVYATGGVAWADAGGDLIARNAAQIGNARGSYSSTKTGWTAGGGIEWAFGGSWTARAEYLYYDIAGHVVVLAEPLLPGGPVANFSTDDTKVHVLRVGVNYKFGGPPAVAAADMPLKAPRTASAAAAPFSWTGLYLGGHRGYGWSNATGTGTEVPPSFDQVTFNLDGDGIVGGAQFGYNWQVAPNWVIGVEADVSGTGIRGSSIAGVAFGGLPTLCCDLYMSKEIDWLATVRGRLGYAWDRWMVYATGGVAWAGVSGDVFTNRPFVVEVRGSYRSTKTGWTGGGGIEWAFAGNWTARAEYLYYDIDGFAVTATDTVGVGITNRYTTDDTKVHVFRVGASYKFGGLGGAPVVARY